MVKYILLIWTIILTATVANATTYTYQKADEVDGLFTTQNLLKNPGAEKNVQYWTASGGGTLTRNTTSAKVYKNAGGFSWDASATSQTVTTTAVAIPTGWGGKNGVVSCAFKCAYGSCTHTLTADDETNNLATPVTITSDTSYWQRTSVNFIYPTSGNVRLKITSAANEPDLYWDSCHLGLADEFNISQVSQATLIGQAYIDGAASCQWSRTNTAMGAFTSDADCGGPVIEQNPGPGTISTTDTDLPKFTVSNLPPGTYQVTVGVSGAWCAASSNCAVSINDGTTTSGNLGYGTNGETFELVTATLKGVFVYTSASSRTFEIYGQSSTGAVNINPSTSGQRITFSIYRFPATSETAYRPDQLSWYVDATMDGANPSLGTVDVSSFTEITHASLTLKPQSGTAAVGVMCSSTNAATAPSTSNTTCAAGDESVGINFTIPKAGSYEVCWYGGHYVDVNNTGAVNITTQLIETPTNAQTLTLEGGSRINFGTGGPTVASSALAANIPVTNCSVFNWSSAGTKGVRLMYEQDATATLNYSLIVADAAAASGQRNMRWTVKPITQSMPMPVLVGGVTAPDYVGATKINTIVSKSANYTATDAEETIVFTADATLSLPAASNFKGKKYHVISSGSGTDVTIDPNASETVCGQTTIQVNGTNDSVEIQSDGSNWIGNDSSCERTTRLKISNSGTPTITSQQGNWVSSLSDGGTGVTTINIPSGVFSAIPTCSVTITNSGGTSTRYCNIQSMSTTAITEYCFSSGSASDENNDVLCKGPR